MTTSWGLVVAARRGADTLRSREALANLCRAYWKPLYAYARRRGYGTDEASDLTQAYFARLLEKDYLQDVVPETGRFRAFLLASLKHFIANERERARALKRGGGDSPIPIDLVAAERQYDPGLVEHLTPESLYEKRWAMGVIERALERLRERYVTEKKAPLFDRLKGLISGDESGTPRRELATELGLTEPALRMAIHRARKRFRITLREEVATTVADPSDVDDELRHLLSVLRA